MFNTVALIAVDRCRFQHVRTPIRYSRRSLHFCRIGFLRRRPELRKNGVEVVVFNNADLTSSPLDRRET
ncbi:hypothetical protein GQ457_01G002990 [Hibiscus cannabinus]